MMKVVLGEEEDRPAKKVPSIFDRFLGIGRANKEKVSTHLNPCKHQNNFTLIVKRLR
jgi:hypothetical protein